MGKEKPVIGSVDTFWDLLGHSQLLTGEELQEIAQRRGREGGDKTDLAAFLHFLTTNQYLTEFQAAMLLHGQAAHLRLGPYKLLERIGREDRPMVYKAIDRLGRLAALKVLPSARAREPHILARFQREARLLQNLDHPNVIRALGGGEEGGLHYLAMEYLQGENLKEALTREGRLEVAKAVAILHQALRGLQYLHTRGMVHRNLEPANLMLLREGSGLIVKILDVSLSRPALEELSPEGPNANRLPLEGVLPGAPGYLAPEQARDARAADIRSDIYSLGCILYQALAGRPPFQEENSLRQMIRHATELPRPLREFNPEVPEGLALVVSWMMAKDPAHRYQTPERAARALEPFLPVERRPPPSTAATQPEPADQTATLTAPAAATEPAIVLAEPVEIIPVEIKNESALIQPTRENLTAPELTAPTVELYIPVQGNPSLSRRDYLFLIFGAVGLLLAQALGWLAGRLTRAIRSNKVGSDVPNAPTPPGSSDK